MTVRYSPRIKTDSLEAYIDPFSEKCQANIPVQNRNNFPTNWVIKRSNWSNVTGTVDPPPDLPSDATVWRLEIDLSTHANTLHRAQNGSSGFTMVDPNQLYGSTRYNIWARGDSGNTNVNTNIQCDIGDENSTATGTMTVGASTNWQNLELSNVHVDSYSNFIDMSPNGGHGEVVYVSGISIIQSITDIALNQQDLTNYNPGYMPELGFLNRQPIDLVNRKNTWTITEAKWDPTDKYFQFDAPDMYIKYDLDTPPNLQGDPDFTVMQVIRRTGTINAGSSWGIGGSTSLQGVNNYAISTNLITLDLWGNTTIRVAGETYPLNEWVVIHWRKYAGVTDTSTLSIWINETEYTGSDLAYNRGSGTAVPNINTTGLVLGRAGASLDNYYIDNADIGPTAFYSAALSDDEILTNVRIMKHRYGIQ